MIDLQQFCGATGGRAYLAKPFTVGAFTYATNGHIMVRVERQPDAPELPADCPLKNPDAPLKGIDAATFAPPPAFKMTRFEPEEVACEDCDERGREHDCPKCECICVACNGTGKETTRDERSTECEGIIFALTYARQMLSLPGIEIAPPHKENPWLFRFDGGVGAIMPMRGALSDHVKIFKASLPSTK